jgi:NurA-like 5'-3' nuclease
MNEHYDEHWQEVIELAKKYGFIVQEEEEMAILTTHKYQEEYYKKVQDAIQKIRSRRHKDEDNK